ncbi:MAG: SPFH domain-containing protein [Anaerolineales bacterium]|jgi:regulator of protease activity HflC (stomatin/prohibitin superfamily)
MLDNLLNVLTIIAWALFGVFLVVYMLRAFQRGGIQEAINAFFTGRVIVPLFLALSLTLLSASLVFIDPQKVGVVISLMNRDGYREQPMRSGLHWIVPLAEQVVEYPIYWQTYTMSTEPFEGTKVGNDTISARSSDGQAVFLDSSIIFRIDPNEAIRVHIDFQNRYIEDFVRPIMRGIIRTEVSQFTVDEINSSKRKDLEANLEELLREEFGLKGFVLDKFLLRNIAFSDQYSTAIEQKQVAEQTRIQREYEAEQARQLAAGQRDKSRIEAEGQADAIRLTGQAEADVVLLKAEAEAQALKLINEILARNKDLITFRYVEKLSPGIQVMLVPNDNPYLLPLPELGVEGTGVATSTPVIGRPFPVETDEPVDGATSTPSPTLTPTPTPFP